MCQPLPGGCQAWLGGGAGRELCALWPCLGEVRFMGRGCLGRGSGPSGRFAPWKSLEDRRSGVSLLFQSREEPRPGMALCHLDGQRQGLQPLCTRALAVVDFLPSRAAAIICVTISVLSSHAVTPPSPTES